ncbi:MAG: hypothetical protein ACREPH_11865 [Rhodanobacteraceae bacterium]
MDTPPAGLNELLQHQREAWRARAPDCAQRMDDLARLRVAFKAKLEDFARVVSADFGRRPRVETLLADGMPVLHEIDHVRAHLKRWMRPQRIAADAPFLPARCEIVANPLGVVASSRPGTTR